MVGLAKCGCSLCYHAVALRSVGKRRLAEAVVAIDRDGLVLLLERLLQWIIWRHALAGVLVLRDDAVHDRWLLQG